MRVPLSWLRDYVDIEIEPNRLAERLTVLGMEVQGLERWGADWQNVVVGELLEVGRHPRADRLSLTRVTVGDGEPLEIVCGATNIAVGQRVPVALPGAVLPGGRRIERAEKMGVVSNGMLCSGEELGLTADGEGILILPGTAPLGEPLLDLYGDWVLDVDVKPNRGDALSLLGLAREVAVATGGSVADVRSPDETVAESGDAVEALLAVDVHDPALCPRFVGRWVSAVRIAPSPDRVQMRLLAAGMRPVSNVVDASNYVMLELGKPIHTFDAAAVAHDPRGLASLVVRLAREGERLETLDHVVRDLAWDTLVIADAEKPLAIAGVMGGSASEVSDATTDVVIESAIFDPVSIRRTAFRYALRSEASLRFEKGQETRLARLGADRTARLIQEWAGGSVARGRIDSASEEPGPLRVTFRPGRVNRLLGTDLEADEQRALLERVGIETEESASASLVTVATVPDLIVVEPTPGEAVDALVPPWRRDISLEADVAEEVARLHGYENVPPVTPDTPMPPYRPNPLEARDTVRATLAGAGLHEVATYALVALDEIDQFPLRKPGAVVADGEAAARGRPISVLNPLSSQHSVLRQQLLPSLLRTVALNERQGVADVAIFEIGKGYGAEGDAPIEWWRLGFVLAGHARPAHWSDPPREWDLDDAKGLVELVCEELRFGPASYEPLRDDDMLHPGRAATVTAAGDGAGQRSGIALTGRIGELHPALVERLDVRGEHVLVGELSLRGLSAGGIEAVRVVPPPRYPSVERDLAVVVAGDVPGASVASSIRAHGGPHLADIRLFDVYRGAPLAAHEKSVAYRIVFRADRTLTEDEVDASVRAIVEGLRTDVDGRIRG